VLASFLIALLVSSIVTQITVFCTTIYLHRAQTHRSIVLHPAVAWLFRVSLWLTTGLVVREWVAVHRKHHAFTDEEGDPHSPHVGHGGGDGWRGTLRGLWHAHVGWLFEYSSGQEAERYAPDLLEDRGMVWISRLFAPIVAASLALAFGLGYALTGELGGALTALLWGGFVRVFFLHHVTWSINSICHFFGRRRFRTDDQSTNVFWLSLISFGESWHHNHHAFPRSAWHGLRWWEVDPGGLLIGAMKRLHLAWNVVRIPPERQAQKIGPAAGRVAL